MGRHTKPTATALGAFIRARRLQNGMTLEQLSEKCGLKIQQLSRYEISGVVPMLSTSVALADALSCTIEDLANEVRKDH